MRRARHLLDRVMLAVAITAAAAAAQESAAVAAPTAAVLQLARRARDADLRGDWIGMARAHEGLAALSETGRQRAWVDYYLAYADWRRSSLAFFGEGMTGARALLREASGHLDRALESAPEMTEARVLAAIVDASGGPPDPEHAAELSARIGANIRRAAADAPSNPRVRLMRAMLSYYSPMSSRARKDSALVEWRQAAESFAAATGFATPEWGEAEGWAWLGGALLGDGKPAEATAALERALALRKDFWWAREIALPQATHSRLAGGRERP